MKLELTIEHLAPYLPYGLKLIDHMGNKCNISYLSTKRIAFIDINGYGDVQKLNWRYASGKIKPILRPLSDLTKEIEVNVEKLIVADIIFPKEEYKTDFERKVDIGALQLQNAISHSCTFFSVVQVLFKYHFDVFGLIENNLAIDINTL